MTYRAFVFLALSFLMLNAEKAPSDFQVSHALEQTTNTSNKELESNQQKKVYWLHSSKLNTCEKVSFQFNVGPGFLYFSGLSGNLSGKPAIDYKPWNFTPLKGRLTYNRSPLFESILGYQLSSWFKWALSYQYQGNVVVQSKMLISLNPEAGQTTVSGVYSQFQSNLSLNGLFAKFYFQLPTSIIYCGCSLRPYLAVGVGPSWQSWTRIQINRSLSSSTAAVFLSEPQFLRQKISANAAWMVDAGIKIQREFPFMPFSLIAGCKYNQWGQARSMGDIKNQESFKGGLTHPIKIKTLYSFAPYLGVEWSFSTLCSTRLAPQVKGRSSDVLLPYFAKVGNLPNEKTLKNGFVEFNAGPTFLYFHKLKGDLFGNPSTSFGIWGDVALRGNLKGNKVPLFEMITGYQFKSWIKAAFSYQTLNGLTLQTRMLNGDTLVGSSGASDYSQLQANLLLNSIFAKLYLELPYAMIWKSLASTLYFDVGVGPSWQSWTQIQVNRTDRDSLGYNSDVQPLRQKTMANASFLIDFGIRTQSILAQNELSINVGCKYNQWGQARNIGKLSQQSGMIKGLNHPVCIKVVYSFTPYLGVRWSFPSLNNPESPCMIGNRSISRFKPFWTTINNLQAKSSVFTQFNVGVGFLYFNKISGGLEGIPASLFVVYGPVPLKQNMIYNRTPLFEYLVGQRFNSCWKLALSYQHQGGVVFQTQILNAYNPPIPNILSRYSQLQANVSLDSLMAKCIFELPYSLISKGIGTSPYFAIGCGPGWQSWTAVQINRMYESESFVGEPQILRQKISANFVWMLDVGLRMQSASPCSPFSLLLGCKYNQWGQARSLGKITQQNGIREGLSHPFRIKTVYSFAPYFGVQWNF
ncbi:MAG: hypothetical protein S4CHLAM7_09700 [Chlamydiae bacterium]|nr:hypothetical protein [Chlamydiota bacterium]